MDGPREGEPDRLLDEPQSRRHRSPGGEEIVDDEHALARGDGVLVHGQGVPPILQLVLDLDGLGGKLPQLADGDEARAELMSEGTAEDEAARLDTDDDLRARLDAI